MNPALQRRCSAPGRSWCAHRHRAVGRRPGRSRCRRPGAGWARPRAPAWRRTPRAGAPSRSPKCGSRSTPGPAASSVVPLPEASATNQRGASPASRAVSRSSAVRARQVGAHRGALRGPGRAGALAGGMVQRPVEIAVALVGEPYRAVHLEARLVGHHVDLRHCRRTARQRRSRPVRRPASTARARRARPRSSRDLARVRVFTGTSSANVWDIGPILSADAAAGAMGLDGRTLVAVGDRAPWQ